MKTVEALIQITIVVGLN